MTESFCYVFVCQVTVMRTTRLTAICILMVTTRCQNQWRLGPKVNKIEQVSIDDHQMSVAVGVGPTSGIRAVGVRISHGDPLKQNVRQTPVKTLSSCNFVYRR